MQAQPHHGPYGVIPGLMLERQDPTSTGLLMEARRVKRSERTRLFATFPIGR